MSNLDVQSSELPTADMSADERTDLEMAQRDSSVPPSHIPDLSETELSKIKEGYDLFTAYLIRTGQKDKPKEGEEKEEEVQLFDGSTHSFLVTFGETKDVPRLVIAVFVILVQMVLYIVTANDALSGIQGDEFTVPVSVQFGRNCNIADNLVCAPEMPNLGYTVLAACILAFFLMHDLIAGIRLIVMVPGFPAKITGILVLCEAILAAFIGTIFALSASEGYDAIANCIGVLFIHDVDEKAFEAVMALKVDKAMGKCWKKLSLPLPAVFISTFFVMVFSMSLAAIIRDSEFANLEKIYGSAYADKYFSADGTFNYDAVWSDDEDYNPAEYWDGFVENGYWGDTSSPTRSPTDSPTAPTQNPVKNPTSSPTPKPTHSPTAATDNPTPKPTGKPADNPTPQPTLQITLKPTSKPVDNQSPQPTSQTIQTPIPTSQIAADPTLRPTPRPLEQSMQPTPYDNSGGSSSASSGSLDIRTGCRPDEYINIWWVDYNEGGNWEYSVQNCDVNQCKPWYVFDGTLCCDEGAHKYEGCPVPNEDIYGPDDWNWDIDP